MNDIPLKTNVDPLSETLSSTTIYLSKIKSLEHKIYALEARIEAKQKFQKWTQELCDSLQMELNNNNEEMVKYKTHMQMRPRGMNKEDTVEAIKVMQAYVDGKIIEVNTLDGWKELGQKTSYPPEDIGSGTIHPTYPDWNWKLTYRIKPE